MRTKEFMQIIRRKLTVFEKAVATTCGHEEAIDRAVKLRFELEDFILAEHERLVENQKDRGPL